MADTGSSFTAVSPTRLKLPPAVLPYRPRTDFADEASWKAHSKQRRKQLNAVTEQGRKKRDRTSRARPAREREQAARRELREQQQRQQREQQLEERRYLAQPEVNEGYDAAPTSHSVRATAPVTSVGPAALGPAAVATATDPSATAPCSATPSFTAALIAAPCATPSSATAASAAAVGGATANIVPPSSAATVVASAAASADPNFGVATTGPNDGTRPGKVRLTSLLNAMIYTCTASGDADGVGFIRHLRSSYRTRTLDPGQVRRQLYQRMGRAQIQSVVKQLVSDATALASAPAALGPAAVATATDPSATAPVSISASDGDSGGETVGAHRCPVLSAYELQRAENVARNNRVLEELGLVSSSSPPRRRRPSPASPSPHSRSRPQLPRAAQQTPPGLPLVATPSGTTDSRGSSSEAQATQ